ncbi:MAG TPA: hypothetical protein VFB80_02425 [Pirellulaceae bacterium]|nr:hypothetical protein [Pirellulaceae bacterium]
MSTAVPRSRRPWPRWIAVTFWTVLGLLAAALLVVMLTITLGAVHGIEFSPERFERRSYSFYELPFVGIQVRAVRREDLTTVAETFITSNKYIPPPPPVGQETWHIVIGSRGTRLMRRGDASILVQYLDAQDTKAMHRWVKWSEDHPQLAKVFWPAVQQLARHELYVFLPELFEMTKVHSDPVALQAALNAQVVQRLLFLARRLQDRDAHKQALAVLADALALDPANQELQRAQNTSRAALPPAEAPPAKQPAAPTKK